MADLPCKRGEDGWRPCGTCGVGEYRVCPYDQVSCIRWFGELRRHADALAEFAVSPSIRQPKMTTTHRAHLFDMLRMVRSYE